MLFVSFLAFADETLTRSRSSSSSTVSQSVSWRSHTILSRPRCSQTFEGVFTSLASPQTTFVLRWLSQLASLVRYTVSMCRPAGDPNGTLACSLLHRLCSFAYLTAPLEDKDSSIVQPRDALHRYLHKHLKSVDSILYGGLHHMQLMEKDEDMGDEGDEGDEGDAQGIICSSDM